MKFRAWFEEDGESEARTFDSCVASAAAKAFVDYMEMDCDVPAVTVCVRAPDGTVTRWAVTGQMVPEYVAEPLK